MKNILVTGGAGFIGSHLCESLLKQNYNVFALDSFNNFYDPKIKEFNLNEIIKTHKKNNTANFTFLKGDITNLVFLENVFISHHIDAVIHLAGYAGVRASIANPKLYIKNNIDGTINILDCMVKFKIFKFIFASSSSVYGNSEEFPSSEENTASEPISQYAATKRAGELLSYTYHYLYNIDMAVLRFFTVYGERQRPDLAIYKFTKGIKNGLEIDIYGDGSTKRDYTYIDDTIDGIIKSLEYINNNENIYEIFNLGNSKTISLNDVIYAIENELKIKAKKNILPNVDGDVKITCANISKSEKILKYQPKTDFETGIKKFIQWFEKTVNI